MALQQRQLKQAEYCFSRCVCYYTTATVCIYLLQVFLACALLVAVVVAEAPAESGPYPAASGPYPPSGWRPSGPLLMLPARQQVSTVYGPPPVEYGVPTDEYGPPSTEAATEAEPTEQTSEAPTEVSTHSQLFTI